MKLIAVLLLLAVAPLAAAQSFPAKPIRVIVPSPPGDGSDVMARLIGEKLTAAWGQQVVVDNRPGAGGRIGTEAAAKAPADGYTWIMANAGSHGINGGLYRNLPYDLEKDFAPISRAITSDPSPGGLGTITRIGLAGKLCAAASGATASSRRTAINFIWRSP